jgi:hypothetical protein
MSDVTMQELELETAELLPARETLGTYNCGCHHGSSFSYTNGSYNGNGNGNGNWALVNVSGNGNGNFNGSSIYL